MPCEYEYRCDAEACERVVVSAYTVEPWACWSGYPEDQQCAGTMRRVFSAPMLGAGSSGGTPPR